MKVLFLNCGKVVEVNDSYGERLIEQGRAVFLKPFVETAEEPETAAGEPVKKPRKKKDE